MRHTASRNATPALTEQETDGAGNEIDSTTRPNYKLNSNNAYTAELVLSPTRHSSHPHEGSVGAACHAAVLQW